MMPNDHDVTTENIDAWALGALDEDDARELERHLAGCAACTLLADTARETASSLALAVPLQPASASQKAKVIAGASVLQDLPGRNGRLQSWRYWPTAAAASIAVGIGLVAWGVYAQNEMTQLRDENANVRAGATEQSQRFATVSTQLVFSSGTNRDLETAQDAVSEIVAQPDAVRLAFAPTDAAPQSSGRYVWSLSAGLGSLVARGLPQLPDGMKYCLWIVYEDDWVAGGLFGVDEEGTGRMIVRDLDVDSSTTGPLTGFAVSVEADAPDVKHEGAAVLEALLSP